MEMNKPVSISKAAKILGVSAVTLRRWDGDGKLVAVKTEGKHRRYDISGSRQHFRQNLL
jgi:excisionase family DNA binding protein